MREKKAVSKKTLLVGGTSVTPFSAAKHKRPDKQTKKRLEQMRRRYPEVHGRKVDWISHGYDDGYLFFNVKFTDGKNFSIVCSPTIVTDIVDFSDRKTGDVVIIREYYKRR
jgi:actin-related protein